VQRLCADTAHGLARLWLARYIGQNPHRPTEWLWSSFTSSYAFVDSTLLERAFGSRERMLEFALRS
jgi:hypothetical protein